MYKVLLVDDESVVREKISQLINWEQYDVNLIGSCSNAIEAMDIVLQNKPDIIITDIKMPVMNGIEFIKQVKSQGIESEFIILSGYNEFEFAKGAMSENVRHYILKPCSEEEIEEALVKVISDITERRIAKKYSEEDIVSIQEEFAKCITNGEMQNIYNGVWKLFHTYDRNLAIMVCTKVLLKYFYARLLDTNCLTDMLNEIYVTKEIDILVNKISEVICDLKKVDGKNENFIDKIINYINENLDDSNLTLKWCAKELVFMNEDYVSRAFTKQIGENFSTYLNRKRIERAKNLLSVMGEDGRIYTVAEQIGLGHNPRYFSKIFKKSTGHTPKEYKGLYK